MYPTWPNYAFESWGLDTAHIKPCNGKNYMLVSREGFSGWPEGRAIADANAKAMAKFI